MHFDELALALVIAASAIIVVWFLWGRYAAVRLAMADDPVANADEASGGEDGPQHSLGRVGHLVTALMHANEGWQQLSTSATLGGIDSIFVRKRGRHQFEVRFVATTCTRGDDPTANYNADQMADAAVIDQLERLKAAKLDGEGEISGQTIDAIVKAIKRGSVRVTKHLYAHMLASGKTEVYSIGRDGQLLERSARAKRFNGTSHRLMVQTLANGLRQPAAAAATG